MSDDRLLAALTRLSHEELPSATDRLIKARLETAWTTRARAVAAPGRLTFRRFAPVLAALVVVAGLGGAALGAGADSPLWDTRVALESLAANLRLSTDDRVAYLLDLVQSRTEEAARQEAAGHPDAAAKARAASASAVVELDGNLPQIDTVVPTPAPVTPPPTNSPSASASPSVSGVPAVQPSSSVSPSPVRTSAPPTPARTATPTSTPLRTEPPSIKPTTTPSPTPTHAPMTITGTVKDASGANVTGACISTSPIFPTSTTQCSVKVNNGVYGISGTFTPGTTITLYAYWISSTGQHYSASSTATIVNPTTLMPPMTLTLQK